MLAENKFNQQVNDNNYIKPSEQETYNYSVHIDELVKEILAYHSKGGLDKFEEISMFIKRKISKLSINYKLNEKLFNSIIDMTEFEKQIVKQINNKKLKKFSKVNNLMDDIIEKSRILEWAGINFGKETWYKLKLAMNKLMIQEDTENLKFFGKIFGNKNDYYILYGKLKYYPKVKYSKNPHFEPRGIEGLNGYSFWVANNYLEDWYQLPDITPQQMQTSMLFKYTFTGDLKAKVKSFVNFNGSEAHLLRCQILRIMGACFVVPDGYLETKAIEESEALYGIDIGDKVTQVKEDFAFPTTNETLLSLDTWVHEHAYVLKNGKIIETDPEATQVPRMRPISGDDRKFYFN